MAKVVTKDVNTNFFPIVVEVQQGDKLVPYLFIIILDYIMRRTVAKDDHFGKHSTDEEEDVAWQSI